MTPSDQSPERLERVKQALADSYLQTGGEERDTLPPSVLEELGERTSPRAGNEREGAKAEGSIFDWLTRWLRTPQFVGVAAVLLIAAIVMLEPETVVGPGDGPGTSPGTRAGGGTVAGPTVVVLYGLTDEEVEALRTASPLRSRSLVVVPSEGDLDAVLSQRRQARLLLVDGDEGRITAPFSGDGERVSVEISDGSTGLMLSILDADAELSVAEEEEVP